MKKVLALLLALVMIAAIIAGCSGNTTTATSASPTTKSTTTASPTTVEESIINTESTYPVLKEAGSVTLSATIRMNDGANDPKDIWFFDWWQKETGVNLELTGVSATAWDTRKAVILAGGDIDDILMGAFWTPVELMQYGQEEHLFADVRAEVEAYAEQLNAKMDVCSGAKEAIILPDGGVYALPSIGNTDETLIFASYNNYINTEWLETLALEKPETLDDFYNALVAFRDGDPNGSSTADEIPWSGVWGPKDRQVVLQAYGFVTNGMAGDMAMKNGNPCYIPLDDDYRNYLTYMNKLYTEELLDADIFTQDTTAWYAKGADMKIGILTSGAPYQVVGTDITKAGQYEAFLLVDQAGDTPIASQSYAYTVGRVVFSSGCENLDVAVRLVDSLYENITSTMAFYGPMVGHKAYDDYGEEYKMGFEVMYNDQGVWSSYNNLLYNKDTDGTLWDYLNKNNPLTLNFITGVYCRMVEFNADPFANSIDYEASWRSSSRDNILPHIEYVYPTVYLDKESSEKVKEIYTILSDYVNTMEAKFITGAEPLSNYPAFVSELKNLGAEEFATIYLDAYNNR